MAHGLEMHEGQVAFALRGKPAWHGLANHTFEEDEEVTTSQMLDASKLSNWNIQLESIGEFLHTTYRTTSENYIVTRTNPFDQGTDVLSTVGSRYQVVQNEDLFAFGDNLLDGGGKWESAGSIKDGRIVFGSVVIPKTFTIDPEGANDTTKTYLLVHTSHDGSVAVQASITPVRVVCQNTLNLAIGSTKQSFKIRHTATVEGKIAVARETLGLTFKYMDEFEKQAQALYASEITNQQFHNIITNLYPQPEKDSKGSFKKWENKIDLINDLYFTSPTNENIKGTKWGAFNALTERLDYFRTARKSNKDSILAGASGFDPVINAEKNRIFRVLKAV